MDNNNNVSMSDTIPHKIVLKRENNNYAINYWALINDIHTSITLT